MQSRSAARGACGECRQNPLASPRPLHYRPPPATTRNLGRPDQATITRKMEFNVDIGPTGEVTGVTPLPSGATANQTSTVRRALEKAWFSPRFEEGKPVATTGHLFAEYWFEPAPDAAPAEGVEATDAAEKKGGS